MDDATVQYNWMTGDHTIQSNPVEWLEAPQAAVEALQGHQREHPPDTSKGKKPIKLEPKLNDHKTEYECKTPSDAVWVVTLSTVFQLELQDAGDKMAQMRSSGISDLEVWLDQQQVRRLSAVLAGLAAALPVLCSAF